MGEREPSSFFLINTHHFVKLIFKFSSLFYGQKERVRGGRGMWGALLRLHPQVMALPADSGLLDEVFLSVIKGAKERD